MLKILNMTRLIFARPECDIRGPRLIARFRWTVVSCGIVSFLMGWSSLAQPARSVSLFSASAAPANAEQTWNDNTPVELGVKFQTSVAGTVTGIRFYKARKNTSAHVGNLWSTTGALLATTKFIHETDSGWQQVNLTRPVTLTPRTTYIVSYHTTVYSADENYFARAHTRGPLTALASSASGGNGVYAYGSSSTSSFPARSYKSSNYWVDVAFLAGAAPRQGSQSKLRHQ
jgi:hypothetical protein